MKIRRSKMRIAGILVLAVLLLSGCVAVDEARKVMAGFGLHFTPEEYPRVDGSTLTIPSEAVAAAVMGLPIEEARQYISTTRLTMLM